MAATGNEIVKLSQLKRLKDAQDTSIASAVAAEASEREKQDGLLEQSISTRLGTESIIQGENVTVTPNIETHTVTISANKQLPEGGTNGQVLRYDDGGGASWAEIEYDQFSDQCKQDILDSIGSLFPTQQDIDEAYTEVIEPNLGVEPLTQDDIDWAMSIINLR